MQEERSMSGHEAFDIMARYEVNSLETVQAELTALRGIPDDGLKVYTARTELRRLKRHLMRQ
jgi:hypothetical protein